MFSKTGQIENGIVQNGPLILVNINGYVNQPKDNSQDKKTKTKEGFENNVSPSPHPRQPQLVCQSA